MPVSHFRCGLQKVGSTASTTHADGFSGTVAIGWAGDCQWWMPFRFGDGGRFGDTRDRYEPAARAKISLATPERDRRCSSGPTIRSFSGVAPISATNGDGQASRNHTKSEPVLRLHKSNNVIQSADLSTVLSVRKQSRTASECQVPRFRPWWLSKSI